MQLKIVTWNCNMAFRKKAHYILAGKPDVVIIPECEHPDKLKFKADVPAPTDIIWHGTNKNKGLAVLSYGNYKLKLLSGHNTSLKHILPLSVTCGRFNFALFAVWANNPDDKDGQYVTQVWKALHHYNDMLSKQKVILAGDFNSNTIWDRPRRKGNHSDVVKLLETKNIRSTYHAFYEQQQGREEHPTLYLYRHRNKPYHLDYCFASGYFIKRLVKVEMGNYDDWHAHSDHSPLTVTFNL